MKKVLQIVLMILVISTMISTCVLPVASVYAKTPSEIVGDIGSGTAPDASTTTGLTNMAKQILGIIQIASAIAAVILIAVFGFKFILGSAQEKSDYMKSFIPLIVGVVVVFSASSIAKLIFNVASVG